MEDKGCTAAPVTFPILLFSRKNEISKYTSIFREIKLQEEEVENT